MPAGSGHIARQTITGGIKSRLGHTGGVKARLGLEREEEENSEEELLRLSAMKTLDLRGRIHKGERKVLETQEEEETEEEGVKRKELIKLRDKKIMELVEQQEMDRALYKAEKKAKKKKEKRQLKPQVTAVLSKDDLSSSRKEARRLASGRILEELPSASDYSDLDSPNEGELIQSLVSQLREERHPCLHKFLITCRASIIIKQEILFKLLLPNTALPVPKPLISCLFLCVLMTVSHI